jgi:hypothetical protein
VASQSEVFRGKESRSEIYSTIKFCQVIEKESLRIHLLKAVLNLEDNSVFYFSYDIDCGTRGSAVG